MTALSTTTISAWLRSSDNDRTAPTEHLRTPRSIAGLSPRNPLWGFLCHTQWCQQQISSVRAKPRPYSFLPFYPQPVRAYVNESSILRELAESGRVIISD